MGRDVEDWEISLAADELQKNYRKQGQQTVAAQLAGSGEYEITDALNLLYPKAVEYTGDWYDCGTFSNIYKASTWRRRCVTG